MTALILKSDVGTQTFYNSVPHIPSSAKFTQARVNEANASYYVVYNGDNYQQGNPNNSVLKNGYQIVYDPTKFRQLGFVARSARGIDMNGCALFGYRYYSGEGHNFRDSCPDLSMYFTITGEGISSVIIRQGNWAFFTKQNYQGQRITIGGKDTFGPGFSSEYIGAADDMVMSILLLQD